MRANNIEKNGFYSDGKMGVREVLSIEPDDAGIDRVEYRILSAMATQVYSYAEKRRVLIIGTTTSCSLPSFAAWAKTKLTKADCDALLLRLSASRVKLSLGERAFMDSALKEAGGAVVPGTTISFDHTEGRAVSGLAKKGLAVRHKGEVEITALGAAWLQNAAEQHTPT